MASLQIRHPLGSELSRYAAVTNERVNVAVVAERDASKRIVLMIKKYNREDIVSPHCFEQF